MNQDRVFTGARYVFKIVIQTKRVYEPRHPDDGFRALVERLWPRGVEKAKLHLNVWCKDAAPSHALRRWFNHDPAKWREFQRLYRAELDERSYALEPLLEAAVHGPVTLLFSARDLQHNSATVLRDYLTEQLAESKQGHRGAAA